MEDKVILLVEDNPDDELLCVRALKRARLANEIVVARDGVEALDYLLGRGEHAGRDIRALPQVVLMDIRMPRMDGLETLRQIRASELTRRLPVVLLTSSPGERELLEGYDLGANSFVRKPVDFEQFSEAVGQLGLYWMVLNEAPQMEGV